LDEKLLIKEHNLYKSAEVKEDLSIILEKRIIQRLQTEDIAPTEPYNIYDDLDLDRKSGDSILKALCAKKEVIRLEHNLFIHAQSLKRIITKMKNIMEENGFIDIKSFKEKYPLSRKYLIAYLDYLDKFSDIKNEGGKRSIFQ
jgi:selenocysteine-specific elongation factor